MTQTVENYEYEKIKNAVVEAQRFLDRVAELDQNPFKGPRHSAMLRASLDLSGALARLRKARKEYYAQ